VSPLDPRLERHRPALVYDPQEAYRAMSAASLTDAPGNTLRRKGGTVVSRAGAGLSLDMLSAYAAEAGDLLDAFGDPLPASRRFQADPAYHERVYGRVAQDGDRVWLQYWLWSYYNPKHLLGLGRHEGDWELVQIGLDAAGKPELVTYSQHAGAEARRWEDQPPHEREHPLVYVAPLSHACYFEPGAHPYVLGIDNPDDTLEPVLPRVEELGDWKGWIGRWGASTGVLGGRFGGLSPASPARQGQKWGSPSAWHARARAATPLRRGRGIARQAGKATYPKLTALSAARAGGAVRVSYELDRAALRRASRLLVTLHPADRPRQVLASVAARVSGRAGTVELPLPEGSEGDLVARASAYNELRQRSDPLAAPVA